MALGAPAAQVFRRVLGRGLVLGTAGVGLGFLAAGALAQAMAAWVHGVSPTDPATYAVIPVLLLATCAAACAGPAWRAARTDPLVILREG
jgi:ABC-type antimicrobial peptide transport system permease subunit